MNLDYMTCWAMSVSGPRIVGTLIILVLQQMAALGKVMVRSVYYAAARGTPNRNMRVHLFASMVNLRTATSISAFV
jgi:type IV secretory pathway TraG/TraD family ATPase VirD4